MIGAIPPNGDRGKNFVMDPKMAKCAEVQAEVILQFKTTTGRQVLAKRKAVLSATAKALKFESKEHILKTKNERGEQITIGHHCSEIDKQIPELLGISKPILDNVILCHQDESLWPFSDNNTLKNIFDELFETKRFTKLIEALWDKSKDHNKQLKQLKAQHTLLRSLSSDDKEKKSKALKKL